MSIERKTLLSVLVIFAGLCAFRAYHMYVTSFIVSDEYRYVRAAIGGQLVDPTVGQRFFFTAINAIIFYALRIQTLDQFVILLPFYLFFWGGLTLILFYKLMKLLEFHPRSIALALPSAFVLVSFSLLALGFLTESVSLSLATLGVYLLLWYAKSGRFSAKSHMSLLAASLSFAAASFTRETYYIFLLGGIFVVILVVISKRKELRFNSSQNLGLLVVPILVFSVPSTIFSVYPNDFVGNSVTPLVRAAIPISNIVDFIFPKPGVQPSATQSITESSSIVPGSSTTGGLLNSTTPSISTSTSLSSTLGSSTTTEPTSTGIQRSVLLETVRLFVIGLALGWGPVSLFLGVAGAVLLFRRTFLRHQPLHLMVALLCLLSFASYFVLAYLAVNGMFSNSDPLSFQYYSTIIRFTDSAVPAYFLGAPFMIAFISTKKRYLYPLLAAILIFGATAVQVYPTYASSNLGLPSNPFSLDFRSGGAIVRDYVLAHRSEAPFYIVGFWPETWNLTIGTSQVGDGIAYFFPSMNRSEFISHHWTTFYVYGYSIRYLETYASFLVPFVYPNSSLASSSDLPITVISREVVANQTNYLVKFQIEWNE